MSDEKYFPLKTHERNAWLVDIYKTNRNAPKWDDLVSLHDDEDREYFAMLDKLSGFQKTEA